MHKLLERQLRKFGGTADAPPADFAGFLRAVDAVYADSDQDRRQLERSMELASAELLEANGRLELERARLRTAFIETPAAVALYEGPDQRLVFANRTWEELTGRKEQPGKTFRELFPEFEGTGLIEVPARVFRTGEPFLGTEVLVPMVRKGAREDTWWNFVWQPLTDQRGVVTDLLLHAVEVTTQVLARHQTEERAERLARLGEEVASRNAELDQFAYATSHDLRSPLRGIGNLAAWIEEDLGSEAPGSVLENLHLLRTRVLRMESLIDGILEYSRAGRLRRPEEDVDVAALLREVVELLAPRTEARIEVASAMPLVRTGKVALQQVFMNLIGNALKHSRRADVSIAVSCEPSPESYVFTVRDDGAGIAPEYHRRVFEIFQKLESRDIVEGSGIGLAVVKKIVESHGGNVALESRPGEGASFKFSWPRTSGRAREPARSGQPATGAGPGTFRPGDPAAPAGG